MNEQAAVREPRGGEDARVARQAGKVGAATMASRVLGLVREQVMASLFGAGLATDAFNVAFRIPNLLRDLFAEGAMSSAFVPTFTEYRLKHGDDAAWELGRQVMIFLLVVLLGLCVVGYLGMPWLVRILAPGFSSVPGKLDLTVVLSRWMLPFLPAVALAAAAAGMLNARGQFLVPALAPTVLNVGMILGGIGLVPVCLAIGQPPILAMAWGVLIGGLGQFFVQLPALRRLGFRIRLRPDWRHPGVARVAWLMLPATLGLAATQLNLFVSTLIASFLEQGSVSWLWYAFRLMQLPIGVFGVALATVALPALSQAAVEKNLEELKNTLSSAVRLVLLLTVPAALWMAFEAVPLVALLYEHGRFVPRDTQMTALALLYYCVGLPAYAAARVLIPTFYALGDTRTPVRASILAVGVNLGLNLALMGPMGHLGLALSTSLTALLNFAQLTWYLRGRVGPLGLRRIAATGTRVTVASLIAVAVGAGVARLATRGMASGLLQDLVVIALSLGVAVPVGFLAMRSLRVEELSAVKSLLRTWWRRLAGGGR
jgi:putative peptidoglycan lipid II flippase